MNLDQQFAALPDHVRNLDPSIYLGNNFVVLDFETTNLDKGHWRNNNNKIVLTCWSVVNEKGIHKKYSHGTEYELSELVDDCNSAEFIVAHNAQFELGWLSRCGLDIGDKPVFCTQIAEHVLSGNRQWKVALEECCKRRSWDGKDSVVSRMIKDGVCPSVIPTSWLLKYCEIDVDRCLRLFLSQRRELLKSERLAVLFCRCLLTPVLADTATRGMMLDPIVVEELYQEYSLNLRGLEAQLADMTGGVNPKSGPQMRELLFEKMGFEPPKNYKGEVYMTPKGDFISTSAEAMNALKATNKEQRAFLKLRTEIVKLRDAMSKYLRHFHNCVEENEIPIMFGEFNQSRTQTHRLSSTGAKYKVQFQNIDNRFKRALTVRNPDWWFSEKDQSQLEYRAAVDMAGDEGGLNDILNKVDAHAFSAGIIFKKKWDDAQTKGADKAIKAIRRDAKAHTFKPLYGGSSGTPAQKAYYKAFKEKHKGIVEWQEDNKATVLREGCLRIPSGLIFYWPGTKVQASGYITNTPSICNYPVQSFATADIVPLGVVYTWHRMRVTKLQSFIINTVHDSVLAEVHPEEVEIYEAITNQSMVNDVLYALKVLYDYDFTTPLEVEGEYTKNWGDNSQEYELDTA